MSQPIKIPLSFLERKIIADLLPTLSSRMKLDTENGRVLTFAQDEAQAILEATRNGHHDFRGAQVPAAENIAERFPKAIEDSHGIAAIPVGERLYQFKIPQKERHDPSEELAFLVGSVLWIA